MKKYIITAVCSLVFAMSSFSQAALSKIYSSNNSNERKLEMAEKVKNLHIIDHFAMVRIKYDAQHVNRNSKKGDFPELKKALYEYESLLPGQRDELEAAFPNIGKWYESMALGEGIHLFYFPDSIKFSIPFKDMETISGANGNTAVKERALIDLIKIQRELFNSNNLVIEGLVEEAKHMFLALNSDEQDRLSEAGYKQLLAEQLRCYYHKQREKNCICGGSTQEITEFPDCSSGKNIQLLTPKNVEADESTEILISLNNLGDFSSAENAEKKGFFTWANVNGDIVKELIFLECATLGKIKVIEHVKINLLDLWDKGESTGSNNYLIKLGFTRDIVSDLQNYYSCVLRLERVAKEKYAAPPSESKPVSPTPKRNLSGTSVEIIKMPRKEAYSAYKLDEAVSAFLKEEIANREEELAGTCLDARALNDSTYVVILNRCDSSDQVFAIMESENEAIGKYFRYCSNIVATEIKRAAEVQPLIYTILVTGTADQLKYSKNQELAEARAQFVIEHLGEKVKDAQIAGLADILPPKGEIDLPVGMRFVSLTFTLTTIKPSN
jgi:hypothetical protein